MAWKARLSDTIMASGDQVVAVFEFYDDTVIDPETQQPAVRARQAFSFPPSWSNADMQTSVIARGVAFKAASARAGVLANAFPPGTTVLNIP